MGMLNPEFQPRDVLKVDVLSDGPSSAGIASSHIAIQAYCDLDTAVKETTIWCKHAHGLASPSQTSLMQRQEGHDRGATGLERHEGLKRARKPDAFCSPQDLAALNCLTNLLLQSAPLRWQAALCNPISLSSLQGV